MDTATNDFVPNSPANAHCDPTQFNKLDCTLVQLSMLTLLYALCVIQIIGPRQAQIRRAI